MFCLQKMGTHKIGGGLKTKELNNDKAELMKTIDAELIK